MATKGRNATSIFNMSRAISNKKVARQKITVVSGYVVEWVKSFRMTPCTAYETRRNRVKNWAEQKVHFSTVLKMHQTKTTGSLKVIQITFLMIEVCKNMNCGVSTVFEGVCEHSWLVGGMWLPLWLFATQKRTKTSRSAWISMMKLLKSRNS